MLGSNPSADSVASTDPGGCCASPFHLFAGKEPASGEASKRKILGVRGQSPRRLPQPQSFPRKQGASDNACIGDNALIENPWKIGGRTPASQDQSDKSLSSNYHR
jgi:hypothetical protein